MLDDALLEPRVHLTDVVLKIRKVKVDQAVSDGVERMLKQTPGPLPHSTRGMQNSYYS